MTITIVGLGLMGSSLALALRDFEGATLWGVDSNPAAVESAVQSGAIDAVFEEPPLSDIVIACLPPKETVELVGRMSFKSGALFCEVCGVKSDIVPVIASKLPEDVEYIPLHPMAGKESGGYAAADARLFSGAGLIITPPGGVRPRKASLIERTARFIGFSRTVYATPEQHDAFIAYTSHLPHITALALCLNMPDGLTAPFAGGSFRDGTRVASINPSLWSQLLLENRENNLRELDRLQHSLNTIKTALENKDRDALSEIMSKAKNNKTGLI